MDVSSFLTSLSSVWVLAQAEMSAGSDTAASDSNWEAYAYGAMFVFGIFVLPFIIGHFVAKAVRMPAHATRIGTMLAAIFGALLFAWGNDFMLKFGVDMRGGTTLVYDIKADEEGEKVNAGALATALADRVDPSGTQEITIRPRGESQIEITVPMTDEFELQRIKNILTKSGQLEFRIVANTRDHQDVIELARAQSSAQVPKPEVLNKDGDVVGLWYTVGRESEQVQGVKPLRTPVLGDIIRNTKTGQLISNPPLNMSEDYALEKWMKREGIDDVDVLMSLGFAGKPYTVVEGDDLAAAAMEFDRTGQPTIGFRLTPAGASRMLNLTSVNQPDGNFKRRMAIIMDKKVLTAPELNSAISTNGQITGSFTREEVNFLVTILRSGRLPATLEEEPASENRVGAGLGATTIQKGTRASLWAVIATFVCILVYYRFAGVVASMALIINGLLIFGVMIFIGQPLTLPGLAGLVLTVGMSVDANVLIFERIREEKSKGAAPRMSIRNGFDRAFTTIVDSNVTTLISAIVLYWIGTDQVRGFAVALIIGIVTSVFTATFCSRIVFDIAEKLKMVSLGMSDGVGFIKRSLLGEGDVNFMSFAKAAIAMSLLLIAIGVAAVTMRGQDMLNIDFTGGTSVTFQLEEPVGTEQLREVTKTILDQTADGKPIQSTLVRVEKEPLDTVYTLVTSIDDEKELSQQLLKGFEKNNEANLVTYRVKVVGQRPKTSSLDQRVTRKVVFTSLQQEGETAVDTPAADTPTAGSEGTTEEPAEELATAVPTAETEVILEFSSSNEDDPEVADEEKAAKVDGQTLREQLLSSAEAAGIQLNTALVEVMPDPLPEGWTAEEVSGHSQWKVVLPVDEAGANAILGQLQTVVQQQPLWLSLSQIGTRVAGEMQQRAIAAILLSLVFIVGYIWFRFQKISYGLAAVVALVHDVAITLGVIALCHWLSKPLGFLMIEDFKIGLTEVAAFLTIIGYSLNDTIVVFDRIREVRGRSPRLDAKMINESVNQTLSRTLLTSGTTLLSVLLLYLFGGEGIHAFAFALLVGIIVGTYSSIFIASPVLLWFSEREAKSIQQQRGGALSA